MVLCVRDSSRSEAFCSGSRPASCGDPVSLLGPDAELYMMVGQDLIMQKWLGHLLSKAFSNKILVDRVLETDESLYCVSYRKNFLQLVQHTSAIQQFIYYLFV